MQQFLPVSKKDMKERGIEQLDFVYVCGDAYVDHPSFGAAIICRILELHGYTVGIIPQPDWKDDNSINILGEPRLGFFVSAGNMDSMVNHYSVSKHHREYDNYSPGGKAGLRPDYATIVYCNLIRHTYKTKPIIIGGIEASLRRLAHYDYWSNKVRRSILLDSGADIISYGMGERSVVEIADCLASGMDVRDITYIDGTVYKTRDKSFTEDGIILPSFEEIKADKKTYAKSFYTQYVNTDAFTAKKLVETYDGAMYVIQNPPQKPLSRQEMDDVYAIEYMRAYHPMYEKDGGIPAIKEVKFSLISNRGCFGGCNFCALTFHQGRIIQSRSQESIIDEAKLITQDPEFKGYIHDVGGPTANFRNPSCKKQMEKGVCTNRQCLFPTKCPNLQVSHKEYVELLTKLRKLPKVKKVFVRSGVRFDYVMYDKDDTFLRDLCKYHISGQLKVAPEHISNNVLSYLGKPDISVYNAFCDKYAKINKELGLKQYLVPYLMSSHPGSTLDDAIALAEYLRDHHLSPEQVQDFYPTPSTISTTMYYTEIDPRDMKPVYVCKNPHEKAMQRALIQYKRPENYDLVKEALMKAGREDLIGFGEECLIPPRKIKGKNIKNNKKTSNERTKNRRRK
ncbi:YgiQ family radical SAM protein [Pseudobutyrivibrio xylanivorans]|uniref:Uncharacterized radical SAM protein YgiQ n=1 Tax=Pseudobutyrivibrio xylanivorans DSM 14809 TaxID=1123012 RepID=A0A1M6J5V3_PSEXY|nr:YgiQ family radical SAM protein [Pseudobutyrivibrio xylanivorans]SHJ42037.1 uncharacterized radical SAM protein YgiQ [Pseudobutyrivibrio xylanivorans DSM 14809]